MKKVSKNGQATVEFALLLPILLMISVLIIEVSLLFHNYLVITQVSHQLARLGALGSTNQQILDRIEEVNSQLINTYLLRGYIVKEDISILPQSESERKEGANIHISIPYRVYINIPYFGQAIGLTMTTTSTMRIERI